jgi:peptide/nickel transport system substrate-binding protein
VDPIVGESFWGWALYDPLLTFDPQGNIVGGVAESYSLSDDGLTWTFKIRQGIKFHNGDPLTSADIAFSVEHFASEESTNPWSGYLRANFASMETPDDYTYIYKMNTPEWSLAVPFAWTRILPKNYFESVGQDEFRKNPIGSGPWKFVDFVSETRFEMEANTEHWDQVPAYERVIELLAPEESTRIAMLKRGEVDIVEGLSFDRLVELRDEGYKWQATGLDTMTNISFVGTWLTEGPTSSKKVRQAMSYAINREEIADDFLYGIAEPGGRWFMDENTWGWDPSWKPDPYDPDLAKSLLEEAGYPDAFNNPEITVWVQSGWAPWFVDMIQILQSQWAEVGIQVEIQTVDPMEWLMFFVRVTSPEDQAVGGIFPWNWGSTFNNVYHSANMFTSNGVHGTANDAIADALYKKAVTELDMDKAKQYWTDLFEYAYDEMWINVGILKVPNYQLVDPDTVGEFTTKAHLSLWDAYAGIQHP